ncbi:hypothetical protein [Paenibacillus pabuli]|uniref:hypothetical protein n=1 Tax=Paenibacillus pabuli TaxID=1472 RepID=UPI001FFE3D9A|nr:hypothetical protein [Paenibacillus pabuli]UPK42488.1 hypothetical protein KET34_25360 [Paenibacillus pabuli]
MIEWRKYDPEKPPEIEGELLIYTGNYVCTGYLDGGMLFEQYDGELIDSATHWAPINLPGEEEA